MELYKFRIYCETEEDFVYKWQESETAPTSCPNNPAHEIDSDSITIVETHGLDITKTQIIETDSIDPDIAANCIRRMKISVENGVNPSIDSWSRSYNIDMIGGQILSKANEGDKFSVFTVLKNDTALGTLTENEAQNSTELDVSQAIIDNISIRPGVFLTFTQNDFASLYEIKSVDRENNKIHLESGISSAQDSGDSIYFRWVIALDVHLNDGEGFSICTGSMKGKKLDSSCEIKYIYTHGTDPTTDYSIEGVMLYRY